MKGRDYKALITQIFAMKRTQLDNAVNAVKPQVGQKVGTEVIAPVFIGLVRNIGDLYDLHEIVMKSFIDLKIEVDRVASDIQKLGEANSETRDVKHQVNELSGKFDKTFGSLEDVIDKIQKRDEEGEIGPYG